ncbi:hypothetical protein LCGC14_0712550 [marine sediment metagenome]|uniref:Uncharacterized protein n=1 Tax=marine sediment metagenome TaxID=412755 RepID=A0A0F9QJ27_9ZZZZ
MALPKRVMYGGAYYKGYKLTVNSGTGDYTLNMTLSNKACAANSITVIPDQYGSGDYFKLEHTDASDTVIALVASTVFNVGKSVAWHFDFPALELLDAGHKFKLTYTNVAGTAMNVYTCLERITTKSGGA